MRSSLAILIATIQVAGSWLCCCGPERVMIRLSSGRPVAPQSEPSPEPDSSCPHCRKLADSREPTPPAPAEKPFPCNPVMPESCPCGGATIEAVVSSDAPASDLIVIASRTAADPLPAIDFVLRPAVRCPGGEGSEFPFLPAEVRLFVHHALRC